MLLQLRRMKYINDLKMVTLTEILSTHHQFLLQKLYVEEDIGISLSLSLSLSVSSISRIYGINYHLSIVYTFKHTSVQVPQWASNFAPGIKAKFKDLSGEI